jgi:uncharacterized membrane protein YhaH (DUF805 family)
MDPAGLFLSISGRLAPKPFALGAILVYAASLASQALISPPIVARSGFWPFAAAQATLLWGWYALHVKRLRDAEEDAGTAVGIAIVYALAVVLLLFVAFFLGLDTRGAVEAAENSSMRWLGLASLGGSELGGLGFVLAAFLVAAFAPCVVALAFSIWAGTRPSAAGD